MTLKGDHFVVSDFNFAYHVWLALPLVSCDEAGVFFQLDQILSSSTAIFPRLMLSLTSGSSRFVRMTFMFL